jgi:Tol biopolymer transport system component
VETPPTATQPGVTGAIFFIFSGDSIASLDLASGREKLIQVGGAPAGLTISPDGKLLAYIAKGAGSAREVFVSSLDGSYTQRVSCLGFPRVMGLAWKSDSKTLAFAASQSADGPIGVYEARVAGSGNCPTDNQQRLIVQTELNQVDEVAWSPAGDWVYLISKSIYAADVAGGRLVQVTFPSGFGPDFSLAPHPSGSTLMYLKSDRDPESGLRGGTIYQLDPARIGGKMTEGRGAPYLARRVRWSQDGHYLLIASANQIWIENRQAATTIPIVRDTNFYSQPILSPDAEHIVYVDGGASDRTVQQIFIVARLGGSPRQLTVHQEGTISDLNWGA